MSGIGIKAAQVTVLAAEGGIASVAAEAGWRVFHGGPRRRAHLALRRREVLAIAHANENRPGATAPSPANGLTALDPPTGKASR